MYDADYRRLLQCSQKLTMKREDKVFNILIDNDLPDYWNGCKIKTDFRQVLKFFKLVKNKNINERKKALEILNFFVFLVIPNESTTWGVY